MNRKLKKMLIISFTVLALIHLGYLYTDTLHLKGLSRLIPIRNFTGSNSTTMFPSRTFLLPAFSCLCFLLSSSEIILETGIWGQRYCVLVLLYL